VLHDTLTQGRSHSIGN